MARALGRTGWGVGLAAALLLNLPGCKVETRPAAPAAEQLPAPRSPMSWRVAAAHLEDIFDKIPKSSIEDFRKDTPEEERVKINASHGEEGVQTDKAYIYGEPAPATTDLMMKRMAVGADDVLYDLGCGRGFFLMQALLSTPLRKAVGVELSGSRIAVGRQAYGMLQAQGLLAPGQSLDLREEDMAATRMEDATLVYMDSVFFSDKLLLQVAHNMAKAPRLRSLVMITKGLPPNPWFEKEATERWKMSWSPRFGSDVLFYRRTAAPAEAPVTK